MKFFASLFFPFLLWATSLQAQSGIAAPNKTVTPDSLAKKLIAGKDTDREKVAAFFQWITSNIAYDMQRFNRAAHPRNKKVQPDTTYDDKSLNERIAYGVLKKGRAVCDGYARLFKTFCDYAEIPATIITGYARSDGDHEKYRFEVNHSWNAVYLDSSWHLLDATWASGYVLSNTNEFVQSYDGSYFLTPPEKFIRNHYPEDLEWALLTNPPTLKEFDRSPFKPSAFLKYKIAAYKPGAGIIKARVGDTVSIDLELAEAHLMKPMAANYLSDFFPFSKPLSWISLKQAATISRNKLRYTFVVPKEVVDWVDIIYNNDVVLRYWFQLQAEQLVSWH